MELPPFPAFVQSVDFDKLKYDLSMFATPDLKKSSDLFTQDQYTFLLNSFTTMSISLLQQYHQWLSEQLRSCNQEEM